MSDYQARAHPFIHRDATKMLQRASEFRQLISSRRTVRDFKRDAVDEAVIRHAVASANSAPSGANMQPWYFVAVQDANLKRQIREAAETEERALYEHRASDEWLSALAPLGTNANKPFLETAPWLIAVFARKFTLTESGEKRKHYYTSESVGIAVGTLITALHYAGLGTLTHTPSPMGFLRTLLQRPEHEKPFLLIVTGYPTEPLMVPDISKLALDDVLSVF